MIITDDFVVLNYPKTGSSFVRAVLREIHEARMRRRSPITKVRHRLGLGRPPLFREVMRPNIRTDMPRPRDQHGTYSQVPVEHRHKPMVSVVRNPYDRVLSVYEFRWWTRYPPVPEEVAREMFPHFPDLSLDEYVRLVEAGLSDYRIPHVRLKTTVGMQTVGFIQMFFKEPDVVLGRLDDAYIESERFIEDMAPMKFLQTEKLNEGLCALLRGYGYSEEDLAIARHHDRVNVTQNVSPDRDLLWTEESVRFVQERERFLFRILEHHGFRYTPPNVATDEPSIPAH